MRPFFAAFIFVLVALTSAACPAYEFHLLNGMVIKGALKSFKDGRFFVKTEFGSVEIEAGKLDYIIVEETDGQAGGDGSESGTGPGMEVEGSGREKAAPAPLENMSVVPPRPLRGWSVGGSHGGGNYPGVFKGKAE
jgi:hypothetical protein